MRLSAPKIERSHFLQLSTYYRRGWGGGRIIPIPLEAVDGRGMEVMEGSGFEVCRRGEVGDAEGGGGWGKRFTFWVFFFFLCSLHSIPSCWYFSLVSFAASKSTFYPPPCPSEYFKKQHVKLFTAMFLWMYLSVLAFSAPWLFICKQVDSHPRKWENSSFRCRCYTQSRALCIKLAVFLTGLFFFFWSVWHDGRFPESAGFISHIRLGTSSKKMSGKGKGTFQKWLDEASVVHIERRKIWFLNQLTTAQGLLLVQAATTAVHDRPTRSSSAPRCLTTLLPKPTGSKRSLPPRKAISTIFILP